jgi:hypothetical protein
MAEPKPFTPVKPVCGIIASSEAAFKEAEAGLTEILGPVQARSPLFAFQVTNYYEAEMGPGLKRGFLSFAGMIRPERLADLKLSTNALERAIAGRLASGARPVNLDPGYLTRAALIMATAKDFSHRVPLADGIYAHLEFLFAKAGGIRRLDWTYPDFLQAGYQEFFLEVRRTYVAELRASADGD